MAVFVPTIRRRDNPIARFFRREEETAALPPSLSEPGQTSGAMMSRLPEDDAANGNVSTQADQTSADAAEDALARLEIAAVFSSPENVAPFVAAYQEIDWTKQGAEEYAQAVALALRVGAHLIARECALAGKRRFPDHPELRKMARILDPPKARAIKSKPNTSWKANRAWLQQHWDDYRGHWVALRDGELLAVADDVVGLTAQVGEIKGTDILITSIW